MALNAGTVFIPVQADMTKFSTSLQGGLQKSTGKLRSTIGKFATGLGAAFAAKKVFDFIGAGIQDAQRADAAFAQLKTTLDSMGRSIAAGTLKNIADQLERSTGIESEAVQEGERLFATFGNISDKMVKDLTPAFVDFAAQFTDGNVASAATMLGKALDNPLKGLTQLSRVGVTFTEQQKEQITALAEGGKVAQAQGLIMEALHPQIDGVGAAGQTAGKRFENAWGAMRESLARTVQPALEQLSSIVVKILGWVERLSPNTKQWAGIIGGALVAALVAWKVAMIGVNIATAANPVGFIVAAVAAAAVLIIANWGKVKSFVLGMWDAIKTKVGAVLGFMKTVANAVFLPMRTAWNALAAIWNSSIGAISFHVPGTSFTFDVPDLPNIPALAEGGIVKRQGLAFVHAAEVITPMERLDGLGLTDRRRGPVEVYLVNPHDIGDDGENVRHDHRMGRAHRGSGIGRRGT